MGMAAKDWCNVDPEICLTDCKLISKTAQHNRKLLLEIMQDQGFINYHYLSGGIFLMEINIGLIINLLSKRFMVQ